MVHCVLEAHCSEPIVLGFLCVCKMHKSTIYLSLVAFFIICHLDLLRFLITRIYSIHKLNTAAS